MAPGIGPTAYAVTDSVVAAIAQHIQNEDSGVDSGDGHHHHHHHDNGQSSNNSTNQDSFSTNADSGNSSQFDGFSGGDGGKSSLVSQFLSASSQEQRTGILVTASFSIVAAMIVIYTIVYDAYRVRPGDLYSQAQKRHGIFKALHTAEVFPFVVAVAIILQGFIFVGVQVGGLNSFEVSGCRLTSELIWPTVWLVPIIVLVFSIETTFRALRPERFSQKGRWATPICLAMIVLHLVGLWLSAYLMPSLDVCPGSLSWWTLHYSKIAVVLASGIIFTHVISATIITLQLMKTINIDGDERIAASRMVYMLVVDIIILTLALPYWIQVVQGQLALDSSRVADIGVTLSGMLFGPLHFMMRMNAKRFVIRPKTTPWTQSRKTKLFGSGNLCNRIYISQPLIEPRQIPQDHWLSEKLDEVMESPSTATSATWSETLPDTATGAAFPMEYPSSSENPLTIMTNMWDEERPLPPEPAQVATPMRPRYSVFPSQRESNQPREIALSPSPPRPPPKDSWMSTAGSDASSEYIELPQPLFTHGHDRKDSTMTSATVEIGMRLSFGMTDMEDSDTRELPARSADETRDARWSSTMPVEQPPPAESIPQINEPEAEALPPRTSSKQPPPIGTHIGIGALGFGPKAGLRPLPNQPTRSSPLANITTTPPTPPTAGSASDWSLGSSLSGNSSPGTFNNMRNLSTRRPGSPAVIGLPTSPKPVHRSPSSPRVKSPLAESVATSAAASPTVRSPTEWPQWQTPRH